jgi:hypothetical protein
LLPENCGVTRSNSCIDPLRTAADARRIAIPAANEHINVCVLKMTMRGESNTVHTRVYQEDGFRFPIWDCLGSRNATPVPATAARRLPAGSFCQEASARIARVHASHGAYVAQCTCAHCDICSARNDVPPAEAPRLFVVDCRKYLEQMPRAG